MSTGHLVGYVGGFAVALGVGAAVMVNPPTASADASSPASHSASAGTATSARAAHRTNTVVSMKPVPTRKVPAPKSSVTLLLAASAAAAPRRTTGNAAPAAAPVNTMSISTDYDVNNKPVTHVTVIDGGTGGQIGATLAIEGTAGTPAYSADGQHAVITTAFDEAGYKSTSHLAVIDTVTGTQVGNTLTIRGDATFTPPLIVTPDASQVLTVNVFYSASEAFALLVDTKTGAWEGFSVTGYPDRAPQLAPDGVHALITTTYYNYDLGDTVVTVMDTETGTRASLSTPSVRVDGVQYGSAIFTADNHAVITTTFTNSDTGVVSTRVAVIDATTGRQIGTTHRLAGRIFDSAPPTLDGDRVVFQTTAGVKVSVNAGTGAVRTTPIRSPWGFDVDTFATTPVGHALLSAYRAVVVVGVFVVVPVVTFAIVLPVASVVSWLGTTLGLG